jgi:hypothetical protein
MFLDDFSRVCTTQVGFAGVDSIRSEQATSRVATPQYVNEPRDDQYINALGPFVQG